MRDNMSRQDEVIERRLIDRLEQECRLLAIHIGTKDGAVMVQVDRLENVRAILQDLDQLRCRKMVPVQKQAADQAIEKT